jgi:hypothetical protein
MDIIVFPYLFGQKKREENRSAHYFLGSLQDANFHVSGLGSKDIYLPCFVNQDLKETIAS